MFKKVTLIIIFIFSFCNIFAKNIITDTNNVCQQFNELNTQVRDGEISKADAKEKILYLIPKIRDYFNNSGGKQYTSDDWVFPLRGYGPSAIGGRKRI